MADASSSAAVAAFEGNVAGYDGSITLAHDPLGRVGAGGRGVGAGRGGASEQRPDEEGGHRRRRWADDQLH